MKKLFGYAAIAALVIFVGLQFVRPDRSNPRSDPAHDIAAQPAVPGDIKAVLERSCFNCHSNKTTWPWYSAIAPVSWLVAGDVKEGRRHLNFSEWEGYSTGKRIAKLDDLIREVENGTMPPGTYLLMHTEAAPSKEERDRIVDWAGALSDSLGAANAPVH
jgi:hypothetical protein